VRIDDGMVVPAGDEQGDGETKETAPEAKAPEAPEEPTVEMNVVMGEIEDEETFDGSMAALAVAESEAKGEVKPDDSTSPKSKALIQEIS